jgi:FkbM family methyltransferase
MIYFKNRICLLIISLLTRFRNFFEKLIPRLNCREILEKNFKKNELFSFIQIGANDGKSFDYLFEIVSTRKSNGIVVEPIVDYFNELVENYKYYPQIIKINKAVHPSKTESTIYKINNLATYKYPDWVKGIASFDPSHFKNLKISSNDIIEEQVECDHLMNIIKANYFSNHIDFIQIDTEGFDAEVIKMLDFSYLRPKILKFENVSLSKNDMIDVKKIIYRNNYYLFNEGNDSIAVDLKKVDIS